MTLEKHRKGSTKLKRFKSAEQVNGESISIKEIIAKDDVISVVKAGLPSVQNKK